MWIDFTSPDQIAHLIGHRIDIRQPGTEHADGYKSAAVNIATGFSTDKLNWLEFTTTDGRSPDGIGPRGGWQVRAHVDTCPACQREVADLINHVCPPIWACRSPACPGNGCGMFAVTPREAVELYAARTWPAARDGEVVVVEVFVGGSVSTFDVQVRLRWSATGPR